MNMRAELHCYHCGYVAARVEGEIAAGTKGEIGNARLIAPEGGPGFRKAPNHTPRCGRCGGPLFIDEIELIRHPPTIVVPLPPGRKRGRPSKAMLAALAS